VGQYDPGDPDEGAPLAMLRCTADVGDEMGQEPPPRFMIGMAGLVPVADASARQLMEAVTIPIQSNLMGISGRTRNLGIDAWGNSPAEPDAWMRTEIAKWARIAREANLKAE
jgi:hypothetical protein